MTNASRRRKGRSFGVLVLAFAVLVGSGSLLVSQTPAAAHGNEVVLEVTSLVPDEQPLTRIYRVVVTFVDGDVVEDATIFMEATRTETGHAVGPLELLPLASPGHYVVEVDFQRFGNWDVTIVVSAPGEGNSSFTEEILPDGGDAAIDTGPDTGRRSLPVVFRFDAGDYTNVLVRLGHGLAGGLWIAQVLVIAVACRLLEPEPRDRLLLRLRPYFWPISGLSLAVIAGSGLHASIYGAPIDKPGVFNFDTMVDIPFGSQYLIAYLVMVAALPVMLLISLRLRRELSSLDSGAPGAESDPGEVDIARPALAGVLTAVVLAVDITVILYLHNISHLSLLTPR